MLSTSTPVADIRSLPYGTMISFRSKNANDTTLWTGTLIGTGIWASYSTAGSQAQYNEAVRQVDPSVPSDYTQLSYFQIVFSNNATKRPALFAQEWIADGSLSVISQSTVQTVNVDDPYDDSNRLLNYLRDGGYAAQLSST